MSRARDESRPIKSLMVKLRNRRVTGGLMRNGSILFRFKALNDHRCIVVHTIRLSVEAVRAMTAITGALTVEAGKK